MLPINRAFDSSKCEVVGNMYDSIKRCFIKKWIIKCMLLEWLLEWSVGLIESTSFSASLQAILKCGRYQA